jgi:hypothetical protein
VHRLHRMSPSLRNALLAAAAALAGCASGPETGGGAGGDIILEVAGQATSARLEGGELTGPQLSLAIDQNAMRGRAYGAVVDVSLKENQVTGLFGGQQLNLQLQRHEAEGFRAQGTLAGALSDFTFTPDALEGSVGPCSYSLRRAGGGLAYSGQRNCAGTRLTPTRLSFPAGFAERDWATQAAILSVMLTR